MFKCSEKIGCFLLALTWTLYETEYFSNGSNANTDLFWVFLIDKKQENDQNSGEEEEK